MLGLFGGGELGILSELLCELLYLLCLLCLLLGYQDLVFVMFGGGGGTGTGTGTGAGSGYIFGSGDFWSSSRLLLPPSEERSSSLDVRFLFFEVANICSRLVIRLARGVRRCCGTAWGVSSLACLIAELSPSEARLCAFFNEEQSEMNQASQTNTY